MSERKAHSPYYHPAGGWGDLVTLSTDGVECSLGNFRVVGYSFPAKLLALRTILRWCRSTRMIPLAKGIPIRGSGVTLCRPSFSSHHQPGSRTSGSTALLAIPTRQQGVLVTEFGAFEANLAGAIVLDRGTDFLFSKWGAEIGGEEPLFIDFTASNVVEQK